MISKNRNGGKMKKKRKWILAGIFCLLFTLAYMIFGNPLVILNNHRLQREVTAVSSEHVLLNEVVPFKWDTLYSFEPYASEDQIEEIIGFKSRSIKETVSEGMVQLLFVRDNKVVSSVLGYESALGYSINFTGKIKYIDNTVFSAERNADMVILTHEK